MKEKIEALSVIRNQIRIAKDYIDDNPNWMTPVIVLEALRKQELRLANKIQVMIFEQQLAEMKRAGL